jgi:hypothetical protein
LLKVDESELVDKLQIIMEQVWITEEMPIEWEEGTVCPIHKKGGQLECGFRKGKSTVDQIHSLRQILEKTT